YCHGLRTGSWEKYQAERERLKVLDEKQSFYGQVTVVELDRDLLLKHNGKTDASTAVRDNRTQLLLGHLPLVFHPSPRRVLAIGLGGGFTLRALLSHAEPAEVTMVEIDPQVTAAAREFFGARNRNVLDDPRVRIVTNDGRNFLDSSARRFDVIASEPPNIWVAGVSGLFTQEFYRSVDSHLNPGGILCQWVPLYEMEREDFRIMLKTISSVFKYVTFWQIRSDLAILASNRPFSADPERVEAKLRRGDVERDLAEIGMSFEEMFGFLSEPAVRPDQVAGFLGDAESVAVNTDDKPELEFRTARNLFVLAKAEQSAEATGE
ncbi:MAG: methyltransferase, partial [bacterium]|nr:methyltransferase [bacterium]